MAIEQGTLETGKPVNLQASPSGRQRADDLQLAALERIENELTAMRRGMEMALQTKLKTDSE